jgi:hypothetical protein
MGSLELTLMR